MLFYCLLNFFFSELKLKKKYFRNIISVKQLDLDQDQCFGRTSTKQKIKCLAQGHNERSASNEASTPHFI